jgi:hypothetical protein
MGLLCVLGYVSRSTRKQIFQQFEAFKYILILERVTISLPSGFEWHSEVCNNNDCTLYEKEFRVNYSA